jgi:hypothetical protein
MIESIAVIFSGLKSAAETAKAFRELLRWRRGEVRTLLEEVKANLDYCWMVIEEDVDPPEIVPELATSEYDRLLQKGFDFNRISRWRRRHKRIQASEELEASDLAPFIGKETADLVENIYDKIKELKRRHKLPKGSPKIQWRRRVINLHKRMLLLMQHLRG